MKRPAGIIVLSILATVAGILYLIAGLQLTTIVTFGPVPSGNGVWLSGFFTIIVGVIWIAAGGALWSLQPWARLFVEIMAIFGLLDAVWNLFSTGSWEYAVAAAVLPGFVFWYANRESVAQAFEGTPR